MDPHLYSVCYLVGLLFQIWMKFLSYSTLARKANSPLSLKDFLLADWPSMVGAWLPGVVLWVALPWITERYHNTSPNLARLLFMATGAFGVDMALRINSKIRDRILSVIDSKTDELDEIKNSGSNPW